MKIKEIETIRPMTQPNLLFVLLRTDDGLTGLGEAFFGSQAVEAYVHETAARELFNMPDASPEAAAASLAPYLGYQGAGAETRGNAAIDLALWDLLGQRAGLPLFRLLGGPVRETLRVYNTCAGPGYVRKTAMQSSNNWGLNRLRGEEANYEDLQAFLTRPGWLARDLLDRGVTGMKIWPFDVAGELSRGTHISRADLARGLSIVESVRNEVGMDMDLMIELHGLWNRPTAARILDALSPYRPYWVEDPMRADAVDGLGRLANETAIPIAVGETSVGRRGAMPLLEAGALDVLTIDLQWTGGLTEARKVAALADSYGIPIAPHDCTGPATLAACVHLSYSQPNALIQETVRAFINTWYEELVEGSPVVEGGAIAPSLEPGHGVKLKDLVLGRGISSRRVSTSGDER